MENNTKPHGFTSEPDPRFRKTDWREKKLRVAAYIRVSTDSTDQENSLRNQRSRYERLIAANPLWEFIGIFADEGISGTKMDNRKGLLHLIGECEAGKIDLVIVKEVSRLARNTRECLYIVSLLADLPSPVGIFFENNNLNTLETGSKIILTVLAMCAELESELKSGAVGTGLEENFRRYKFHVPVLLGYVKTEKHTMAIEPEGAKTVRLIYDLFLAGNSPIEIAAIITELNRPTIKKRLKWRPNGVISILSNEKYAGAYMMQKTFTVSFLTHQTRRNIGQKRIYHSPYNHDPIVSPQEHARALLLLRANHNSPYFNSKYEIRVIRRGLLSGFIPMNVAFGGYDAEHYLAAYVMARLPELKFSAQLPVIPGVLRLSREILCDRHTATLNITGSRLAFNAACLSRLNADYVEILLNPQEKLLALRKTTRRNKNAIPWDSATIHAREICGVLYELMGWPKGGKCKVPAGVLRRGDDRVMMFDLRECECRYRPDEKSGKYVRAVPSERLDADGVDAINYMLRSRRAYAESLPNWRLSESAASVEGFDTYIEPKTAEALHSMIGELMVHGS